MTIRVYFNRHGKKPWSWDTGEGTTEHLVSVVMINGVRARTVYRPAAGDNLNTPTDWIVCTHAKATELDDGVLIEAA